MIDLPTKSIALTMAAVAIAYTSTIAGGAYLKGRADGRAAVVERLQSDRIAILLDGKEIDSEVRLADDDALCRLLGGCRLPEPTGGN